MTSSVTGSIVLRSIDIGPLVRAPSHRQGVELAVAYGNRDGAALRRLPEAIGELV